MGELTLDQIESADELQEAKADMEFLPPFQVIKKIRLAYRGTWAEDLTQEDIEEIPGAGGIVNMVTNLIIQSVGLEFKLNPTQDILDRSQERISIMEVPEMFEDVVQIMEDFMLPDVGYRRPGFRELWKQSIIELLISGGVVAERHFPGFENHEAVKEAMDNAAKMDKEQGPDTSHWALFNENPCRNIIIRGLENCVINRSRHTGFILDNPFWFRKEIAKEFTEEQYVGPLNLNQCVYFTYQQTKTSDYYGQSFFQHCYTEIIQLGRIYRVAQQLSKFYITPVTVINTPVGLSQRDFDRVKTEGKNFLLSLDSAEYERGIALPGDSKIRFLTPDLDYKDIVAYLEFLHNTVLQWCRIPTDLLTPQTNRAVVEVHYEIFQEMVDEIRRTAWEGWLRTHFRPLLREAGYPDWDITPVSIAWEKDGMVIDIHTDGSQELSYARRATPNEPMMQPGVDEYRSMREGMGKEMNPPSQDTLNLIGAI
ncbi:MAG: hypothetical protein PVF58_14245 [Candidatus Methanofastidiosia archaeon]|jgi:hypothetical protein